MPAAPHLDFCGAVRAETRFPVFHAARIADVATARHAVAEGKLDMVGMTRAHLADPHIVNKIAAGREQEIRPCVGATYCLDRRSEEHTSELQSLMRISYAVFCLKKKTKDNNKQHKT